MRRDSEGLLDAVVVGAGSAGLSVSYHLDALGCDHRVIDRGRIGETWRTQRWDTFRLNSPHLCSMLPGDAYEGPDPWGALTQHEFVAYLEDYVERLRLPVETGVTVRDLAYENGSFRFETSHGPLRSRSAFIATGNLNCPQRPSVTAALPGQLVQIDCSDYRSADALASGAVLVVGSGQSGAQIAEDLALAGRRVFLATSRTGRMVRRYRGGDTFNWLAISGFLDVPRREIMRPDGRRPARGVLGSTHTISLQSLSAQGVVLLGRIEGCDGSLLFFGDELDEHIRFADEASAKVKSFLDQYIARTGLDAPQDEGDPAETVTPRLPKDPVRSIDWRESGIGAVIWCTGFTGDFSWVRIPGALDPDGQPAHEEGIAAVPGLYFAGLDFATTRKSGIVLGAAEEAAGLVRHLVDRRATGSHPQ